jgi:hypothetical protein
VPSVMIVLTGYQLAAGCVSAFVSGIQLALLVWFIVICAQLKSDAQTKGRSQPPQEHVNQ